MRSEGASMAYKYFKCTSEGIGRTLKYKYKIVSLPQSNGLLRIFPCRLRKHDFENKWKKPYFLLTEKFRTLSHG